MKSSPHSQPTAEGAGDRPAESLLPSPATRRTVPQRIVDAILFSAIAAGLVLMVSRFLQTVSAPPPELLSADSPEPIHEAVLSVTGWKVFQRTEHAAGAPSNARRLDRLRAIALRAPSVSLPLAADAIETGFQRADLDWAVRERMAKAEIRDTGGMPGTGAVVLHDPADPNGERVLAWYAELPSVDGEIRIIETIRADLADAILDTSPAPDPPTDPSESQGSRSVRRR